MKKKTPIFIIIFLFLLSGELLADGHIELSVHYSRWTLNVAKSLVENTVSSALESDLKDRFLTQIQQDYPSLSESGYSQQVVFDAPGSNVGFELRYYPGGRNGSFSLGLAVEQSTLKVSFPEVSANLQLTDVNTGKTANFQGLAYGQFVIKPLSFHLNMRWELLPSKIISPYFSIGAGISTSGSFFDAQYKYAYTGTLSLPDNSTKQYSQSDTKTLRQIKDDRLAEGKDFPINFLPILQINFGLRARISRMVNLTLDAGFFDGFLFRGGLAIRI
ncbi:MAG: hypothetical protein ACPLZD_02330 [Candidatus Saccharicenans sp.]|nr:MAG: hypothetical protein C0168_11090 [Candidatus Aminicenantes bacterium]HEK85315.1 hypothetical protein [Candidatus Aminicenantes bacterium]